MLKDQSNDIIEDSSKLCEKSRHVGAKLRKIANKLTNKLQKARDNIRISRKISQTLETHKLRTTTKKITHYCRKSSQTQSIGNSEKIIQIIE